MPNSPDSNPRWKVTLVLRLEEFGVAGNIVRYQRTREILYDLKGNEPAAPLQAVVDQAAAAKGIRRFVLTSGAGGGDPSRTASGGPLEKRPQDDLDFVLEGIIPFDVQLGLNGFHQADTLSFKVRMADFPFDPRLMKAVGVKFFLGTMPYSDVANAYEAPLTHSVLLPDMWTDAQGRQRSNLRFKGWVDDVNSVWPENDEPYTEFQCRDNTALLLDQEFPPKFATPSLSDTPLDEAIAHLLTNFPQFEGLSVEYRPDNVTPPTFNQAFADTAFRPQLGPTPRMGGGATGGGGKLSVWDYIVDVTGSLGHHARMEGDTIVIQTVQTALSNKFPRRSDDPYVPQQVPGVQNAKFSVRTLVYGRDLEEVKISRNYTKHGPINVQVNCYDPTNAKKVLIARYPTSAQDKVIDTGLGAHAQDKWIVYRVSGFTSIDVLRILAQNIYENLGRQEIKITAKTGDLNSFGGDGSDPDLLDLLPGDSVSLLFRRSDSDNFQTYADIEETMAISAKAVSFLKNLGFDPAFAQTYSRQFQNAGFINTFRVKTIGIMCGEDGVGLELELMNYIEVRADLLSQPSSGETNALTDWNNKQNPGG